jgi:plasmid rolling circle replication initiator protein Rep
MSEYCSGNGTPYNSVSSLPNDQEAPALSEVSERDKPWDKHRKNADKVAEYYRYSPEYNQYASRIDFCSQLLDFRLCPDDAEGVYKMKLASSRFCRVRHCPVCQWRRSLMWKAKAYKILPRVVRDYPKHRWLFLTLTIRNCPITELRDTLQWMSKSWQRLVQRKSFPAIGWIRSTEVTKGKDGNAHPHFHCLLLVKPSYFTHGYMKQQEWVELWRQCLRIDYQPILDIRPVKKGHQPMELIPELLKYCTKESDLVADREWFLELTSQMHKLRAIVTGGVLKDYLKELENEPEDLVGDDDSAEIDEGHLYFGWKRESKKYYLVD